MMNDFHQIDKLEHMGTIHERIKDVRKSTGMTQAQFGERLGTTQNAVINMEIAGRAKISEVYIKAICREFGVSEEWLQTGEGEMYARKSRDEEIEAAIKSALSGEPENFKTRLISALCNLKESDWVALENLFDGIYGDKK